MIPIRRGTARRLGLHSPVGKEYRHYRKRWVVGTVPEHLRNPFHINVFNAPPVDRVRLVPVWWPGAGGMLA